MKHARSRTLLLSTALALVLGACREEDNDYLEGTPGDTDGDGLLDSEELQLGTSPKLADTDGDGLNDCVECIEYGFDAETNPVAFNPLVADVPELGIRLTSPPTVALRLTDTEGRTRTFETSRGKESAETVTTSNTDTNSHSVEQTHSTTAEVGFSGWSVTGKVSYSYSHSTTDTQTHSYTEEQANENRRTLTNTEAYEHANQLAASGGILMVTAQIENRGDLSFRIQNLVLSAVTPDLSSPGTFAPVGNLVLDTSGSYTSFPPVTIGPGDRLDVLNFINDGLDLETGKALLRDSKSLAITPSSYELVDAEGKAFAFHLTDVRAKTAAILVDYTGHRPPERYMVATNADPDHPGLTAREALDEVLHMDYEAGSIDWKGETCTGLLALHGDEATRADPEHFAYWLAVHVRDRGFGQAVTGYDMLVEDYDFDEIELVAGDVLHLVFIEDRDGDGLWSREEFLRGSSDEALDSDGDGIDDAEEVRLGCNPGHPDTDGDGIGDGVEVDAELDPLTPNPTAIAAGERSSFALLADRSLWAWGLNDFGQLGIDSYDDTSWPTEVAGEAEWLDVSSDRDQAPEPYHHSLELQLDGTLWGWGSNQWSMLGDPTIEGGSEVPVQIGGDQDWVRVLAGTRHCLALKANGSLWSWGYNAFGQLGVGDLEDRWAPTLVVDPFGATERWLDVAASRHTVAIRSDGTLWACGRNASGQLGLGDLVDRAWFTQVGSDDDWVQVACGFAFTLALEADSTLYACGHNAEGELGIGTIYGERALRAIGTGWQQISAGNEFAAGIRADGTLWTWGHNRYGQLGLGDYGNRLQPTQVGSDHDWVAVFAADDHALALRVDGSLWAWGMNAFGELGDGLLDTDLHTPKCIGSVIPGLSCE